VRSGASVSVLYTYRVDSLTLNWRRGEEGGRVFMLNLVKSTDKWGKERVGC
jgi:hypothetical protein